MILKLGSPEEVGMSSERIKHLEDLVSSWVDQQVSQAFEFVVARRGVIVSHKAVGYHTPELNLPLVKNTIFPLASLTKPITAAAAMILVEEGALSLNFPVVQYIPQFTGKDKEKVLIHQLMTHTSGLKDEDVYAHSKQKQKSTDIPPAEITQDFDVHSKLFLGYDAPLSNPPGTVMSYCNYGVELLGEIVRIVSGTSLDVFTRQKIFDPLGMNDTHLIVPESMHDRVIRRSEEISGGKWFSSREALQRASAAGGAYSTVSDMVIFGQMLLNRGKYGDVRVLSPLSVIEMTRNQIPGVSSSYGQEHFAEATYGYCWPVNGNKKDSGDLFSKHAYSCGGAGGVIMAIDPVYETVQVIFSITETPNDGNQIWFPSRFLFNNVVLAAIEE